MRQCFEKKKKKVSFQKREDFGPAEKSLTADTADRHSNLSLLLH